MDLSESISPKSDQMDYEDLLSGERTFTITEVRKGPSVDQPVEIVLNEFPRPWRPAKTVRRLLVAAWGADASQYIGRRVTLYGDETVKWAGQPVGGIRVKALSHIDKPLTVALTVTRGKRVPHTVQPLPDAPPQATPTLDEINACTDVSQLRQWWETADEPTRTAITNRANQLSGEQK